MLKKLFENLKHLPTTLAGAAAIASVVLQNPGVQQLAALNPKVAGVIGAAGAVAAGLTLIFGTGAQATQ